MKKSKKYVKSQKYETIPKIWKNPKNMKQSKKYVKSQKYETI